MKQAHFLKPVAVVLLVIVLALGSYFLGDKHGVETMSVKRVNPTQIAEAMKGDHFYSDYRENSLLVSGTVSTISKNNGDVTVGFDTTSSFRVLCDFDNTTASFHSGDNITALSEGGSAQRQPSAVLLKNCVLP